VFCYGFKVGFLVEIYLGATSIHFDRAHQSFKIVTHRGACKGADRIDGSLIEFAKLRVDLFEVEG
jgi:hypothetical protein